MSRDKEEVNNPSHWALESAEDLGAGEGRGWLLRGRAFKARIRSLSQEGLTETGRRHDAALKLAWHLGVVEGINRDQSLEQIRAWLEDHAHASATRTRGDRQFVDGTLREVAHYIDTRVCKVVRWRRRQAPRLLAGRLTAADEDLIERCVQPEARAAAKAILGHVQAHASEESVVLEPLELSSRLIEELCGDQRVTIKNEDGTKSRRRTSSLALEDLRRLGMLVTHTNYSVGHHGRRYTCWYQFGSGVAPSEMESGGRELARREVEAGTLVVEIEDEDRAPKVRVEPRGQGDALPALRAPDDESDVSSTPTRASWWQRMYERRVYVPGDFVGDALAGGRLDVGPFRHRHGPRKKSVATVKPRAPANANAPEALPETQGVLFETPITGAPPGLAIGVTDRGLRDAIARAWAAFEDSS